MKRKRFVKKLALNKETVSNLENNEMDSARGGLTTLCTITQCDTYCQTRYTRCINCIT